MLLDVKPFHRVFLLNKPKHISYQLKRLFIRTSKIIFELIIRSRGLVTALFRVVFFVLSILLKILRPLVLRLYQAYLVPKKALVSALGPATNKFRYLLSNRYVAHLLIVVIAFFTLAGNLTASETTTESIRSNIFLKQVLGDQDEYIEEEIVVFKRPSVTSYLEEGDLLAGQGVPVGIESVGEIDSALGLDGTVLIKPTLSTEEGKNPTAGVLAVTRRRTEIVSYEVQEGDTVSTIATRYGIDTNTILWENGLGPRDYIRPGDELSILPINGIRHTIKRGENLGAIALKYDVEIKEIESANKLTLTSVIREGQKILIPDAAPAVSARSRNTSTVQRIKDIFVPAAKVPAGAQMVWPTSGRRITQYFSWRHHGIDIDGTHSSPIYSADAGTVIKVGTGWSGGYGNHVRVDHGNGLVTLYAHLSRLDVKVGQSVAKGGVLGMMGTTGRSTGTHLHFEVMNSSGTRFNPFNYVK